MREDQQLLLSPDLSSKRTTPERCPRPLLLQDCNQEDPDVPQDHQGEDLTHNNITGTYGNGEELCFDEIPTYNWPDDCTRRSEGQLTSSSEDYISSLMLMKDTDFFPNIPLSFNSEDLSSYSFNQVLSSDLSQTIRKNINQSDLTAEPFSSSEHGISFSPVESQKDHTKEAIVFCYVCWKCFSCQSSLDIHQRTHTEEMPYSCCKCGKYFYHKSTFTIHQRTHTGEKPYSCSECGKSFRQKGHLVAHHKIHTEQKPFSCSECGKCFKQKSHLAAHQIIHTGEKPYSCSKCNKYFNRMANLVRHQEIHKGDNVGDIS